MTVIREPELVEWKCRFILHHYLSNLPKIIETLSQLLFGSGYEAILGASLVLVLRWIFHESLVHLLLFCCSGLLLIQVSRFRGYRGNLHIRCLDFVAVPHNPRWNFPFPSKGKQSKEIPSKQLVFSVFTSELGREPGYGWMQEKDWATALTYFSKKFENKNRSAMRTCGLCLVLFHSVEVFF